MIPLHLDAAPPQSTSLIAVTYRQSFALSAPQQIEASEASANAQLVRSFDFRHAGLVTRVLSVVPTRVTATEAAFRALPDVQSVGPAGTLRYPTSVAQAYWPKAPYFNGFSVTVAPTPSATAPPATYHVGPYDESASVPGQWNMHAVCLGYAFDYSQTNNGSGIVNANALGTSAIKIAIIDTGEDTTHPELSSKIVYGASCVNGSPCTSGTYDKYGHGTDTAGIAAADMNNDFGFAGAGGNVEIYGYRVFPDPTSACFGSNPPSSCDASTIDIADAIQDAVAHHVNVISMSLGGSACTTSGVDPDPTEGNAIADAIAANIVVVAASGNSGKGRLDAPACDSGVIAVGATGLADGQPNGSGNSNGSSTLPYEYVAQYSNYGSPAADPGSSLAWGIVAPGGDPTGSNDLDDLHWIEDIWTSTPGAVSDAGNCNGDYPTDTGTADCRILVAGTSMATPIVAGAAALVLSVNSSYQSPSAMKQLLCSTTDDIHDSREGCGRINIYRAMATALGDPSLP
jgi:subtilisin family serine protease